MAAMLERGQRPRPILLSCYPAKVFAFTDVLKDCVPLSSPSKVTGTVGGSLHGTSKVTGTVGGSLIVQCQYGKEFRTKDKLWCKKSFSYCKDIVKTRGSGGKVRSGRVSISDHPAKLSFTVTMERLTLEDAGSYRCRVETLTHGRLQTPTPRGNPQMWQGRPLVISVHLLLLVLKVLLLLSMLSAVLWVNRPQRSSRSR
ncbi:CMRF35-like molecule 6 [Callospermophilus lateralis]|uniref:CMRF35-like molecule 6 n=1 Tax=Callospermophilus lateralis TaxID=76772 RepID=UPI00403886C3